MSMPPKKSMAARKSDQQINADDDAGDGDGIQKKNEPIDDGEEADMKTDFFDPVLLDGKRKRSIPLVEKTLRDWLSQNFIAKEDVFLSYGDMHAAYLNACSSTSEVGVEMHNFLKVLNELYPKGIDLIENSPYVDTIRKRKLKKAKSSESPGKKSTFHQLKLSDIKEAILEHGNPRKGIHVNVIRRYLTSHKPLLQLDLHPNRLKSALLREVFYGHLECIKGVGACGIYRLPRTKEEEDREIQEEIQVKKEKEEAKKATASDDTGKSDADNEHESNADDVNNKESVVEQIKTQKTARKKNPQKQKKLRLCRGKPRRIEDIFPLAMTYNNEPKQASARKIIKYLQRYYRGDMSDEKVKKCLESGLKAGYWELVTKAGLLNGTFCLAVAAIDPTADDDLTGQIMNAIVACAEPKTSSVQLLKQYVVDYHPEFRVADKPKLFKRAIERALMKKQIVQLSGIGASGSFQLACSFIPSPAVLQGKDVKDDDDGDDESSAEENEDVNDVMLYRDAYVPRPTRHGHGRKSAAVIERFDPSLPSPSPARVKLRTGIKKKVMKSLHTERMSRTVGKKSATNRNRSDLFSKSSPARKKARKDVGGHKLKMEIESSATEDSEPELYVPRKSTSRSTTPVKKKVAAPEFAEVRHRGKQFDRRGKEIRSDKKFSRGKNASKVTVSPVKPKRIKQLSVKRKTTEIRKNRRR